MSRRLSSIAAAAGALALALATSGLAAGAAPAPVGFYGCRTFTVQHPKPIVRPRSIVIACADGNSYLTGLRWPAWRATSAAGTGTLHENDCTPNCAAGRFRAYRAAVSLSRPKSCKGARVFTRVAWRASGKSDSLDYGCP